MFVIIRCIGESITERGYNLINSTYIIEFLFVLPIFNKYISGEPYALKGARRVRERLIDSK